MNTQTQAKYGTADAAAFLNGTAPDAIGRTVQDYLAFDADKWEECHNHVQWAFPNNEQSMFNPNAPVVDMQDFANQLTWQGQENVLNLAHNYLLSLGIVPDNKLRPTFHIDYNSPRLAIWLSHPRDHNFLRLTRLLHVWSYIDPDRALGLLGTLADVAKVANARAVLSKQTVDIVGADTLVFWVNAALGRK
jgi:hypothetical protein